MKSESFMFWWSVGVYVFGVFIGTVFPFPGLPEPQTQDHPSSTQLQLLEQSERAAMAVQIVDSIFHELGEGPWRCEPLREADEDG